MAKISDRDKEILRQAKTYYGKMWRQCVEVAWYSGNYDGIDQRILSALQSTRNDPNRKWGIRNVKI